MQLADFSYTLPDNLIAKYPLPERSASRLLTLNTDGILNDCYMRDLPTLLNKGDLLVLNDTRVIKARISSKRATGGAIEILVERILDTSTATAYLRSSNKPKIGQTISLENEQLQFTVIGRKDNLFIINFQQPVLTILEQFGTLPIPPYFAREADSVDETRYQTVFNNADKAASVAAPTAGLHLDNALLSRLRAAGINHCFVTLHVGAGTFQPVRTSNILDHTMHFEWGEVPEETVQAIAQTKANGGKVIAVGTTATRALESAAKANNEQLQAWRGETNIFIYPSYQFKVIDKLLTNFHLPESTLLMLVSALAGRENIMQAYQHAIKNKYRFYSYGDAMLIDKIKPQGV